MTSYQLFFFTFQVFTNFSFFDRIIFEGLYLYSRLYIDGFTLHSGASSSLFWVSSSSVLTLLANKLAKLSHTDRTGTENINQKFFSIFYIGYRMAQVTGNLIASLILSSTFHKKGITNLNSFFRFYKLINSCLSSTNYSPESDEPDEKRYFHKLCRCEEIMPSLNIRKEILVYLRVYYKVPLKKKYSIFRQYRKSFQHT